ncbi:hypothetical protein KAK06_12680 [Ideonella sp. 4Y11]|uniref:Antitoxin n=1 Tax=Ideonella aquatica TaxID=2824119 RepID=A0A940YI00_9BURK|nr:hypothetical protein [Ideonella aquatica]MBQ0959799.1 hypothetical protein [Ideonella aquatica]
MSGHSGAFDGHLFEDRHGLCDRARTRAQSADIWQRLEAGEEFVITRNGKPFALLLHTEPEALEKQLRAIRLSRMGDQVRAIQASAAASGASQLTEEEIQAEIDEVRRERR